MKLGLIIFLCTSVTIANLSFAGEVFDDFNKATLNDELWVIKTASKGKYEICTITKPVRKFLITVKSTERIK